MDRRAWWATVHGVTRITHDLATKPPPLITTIQLTLFIHFTLPHTPIPLVTTTLFPAPPCFVWFGLFTYFVCILYSTYVWNHTVFVFLHLTSHLAPYSLGTMAWFHFLWPSNNPCVCICVSVCVHTQTTSFLSIHSSVDGHSGCFHILTTVNNAAMNIGMHISFQTSVFVFFE